MTCLVTAFGPFGGRVENASSLALRELKKQFPAIRFRILPVDSVVAPRGFSKRCGPSARMRW